MLIVTVRPLHQKKLAPGALALYTLERACSSSTFTHLSPVLQPQFKGLAAALFKLPRLFPDEAIIVLSDIQLCSAPGGGAVGVRL